MLSWKKTCWLLENRVFKKINPNCDIYRAIELYCIMLTASAFPTGFYRSFFYVGIY